MGMILLSAVCRATGHKRYFRFLLQISEARSNLNKLKLRSLIYFQNRINCTKRFSNYCPLNKVKILLYLEYNTQQESLIISPYLCRTDTLNSNLGSLSESIIFPSAGTISTFAQQYESTSEQSTQYKCSLEVLCKLCFGNTVTKSNEDRVLPLIGAVALPEYFSAALSLLN